LQGNRIMQHDDSLIVKQRSRSARNQPFILPVSVLVWDRSNVAVLSIPVQLTDINDHHPVFAKSTLTVELASSTAHQPLWQAQATDRDGTAAHNSLTYSLGPSADRDNFRIDSKTGVVYARENLASGGSWQLNIIASDGEFSTSQSVTLTRPGLSFTSPAAITVAENHTANVGSVMVSAAVIHTPNVTGDDGQPISWALSGTDAAAFHMNHVGQIWFRQSPDFESKSSYSIVLTARSGSQSISQTLAITVTNVDEKPIDIQFNPNPPTISDGLSVAGKIASISILDDALGTGSFIYLGTSDQNDEPTSQIEYRPASQELWLKAGYEIRQDLLLKTFGYVSGSGSGSAKFVEHLITITDLMDHKPSAFSLSAQAASLHETTSSRTKLATLTVTDDAHGSWSAALSGSQASLFEIAANALWLKAGAGLDASQTWKYVLNLSITGSRRGQLPDDQTFTLTVADDINDPPDFNGETGPATGLQDRPFSWQIPASWITDRDSSQISLSAFLLNEDNSRTALPAPGASNSGWLFFNPASWAFSGQPGCDDTGGYNIIVRAQDNGLAGTNQPLRSAEGPLVIGIGKEQTGGANTDVMTGTDFADILHGGAGSDRIYASDQDSLSWADQSKMATIDMRPGAFSYFGHITHTSDADLGRNTAGGERAIEAGSGLLGIAYNTLIEKAFGGSGNDKIHGNLADNLLWGGPGGTDQLTGDAGNDVFAVKASDGSSPENADRIKDFEDGVDKIGLTGSLRFADLTLTANGSNTRITHSSGTLFEVENITPAQLSQEDFILLAEIV
jgi:hypothetical protein